MKTLCGGAGARNTISLILLTVTLSMPISANAQPATMCGDGVGGLPSPWSRNGSDIFYSNGGVGILTNTPERALDVNGGIEANEYYRQGQTLDARYVNIGQANSITSAMIVDGAVGSADVNQSQVQLRVSGTCAANQKMLGINQNGTAICGTDAVGGSGTMTGVFAGSGLSGGGTVPATTLSVNTAQIQSRISTSCPSGQFMRGVNQNGAPVCQAASGTINPAISNFNVRAQQGVGSCTSAREGCLTEVNMGNKTFCALSKTEYRIDDNQSTDGADDTNMCRIYWNDNNWILQAWYQQGVQNTTRGYTECAALCMNF